MQATQVQVNKDRTTAAAVALVVALGVLLAGYVVAQMGLLNGLVAPGGGRETAVAHTHTLTAADMRFGSEPLRLAAGQPITLQLTNDDFFGHSFDVDALGLHVALPMRQTAEITFTPAAPGTYQIYCGIPGHTEAGMVSTLIVE